MLDVTGRTTRALAGLARGSITCGALLALASCRTAEREGVREVFNFSPLAYYETSESPQGYSVDVLWPLINAERRANETSSRFFPLYYTESNGAERGQLNILLLFNRETDEHGDSHFLFPFFFEQDSAEYHMWHVWPLVGRYYRETDGQVTWSKTSFAWPLFVNAGNTDGSRRNVRVAGFGPLFGLFDYCREQREVFATQDLGSEDAKEQSVEVSSTSVLWVLGSVFGLFDRYDDPVAGERGWSFANILQRQHPHESRAVSGRPIDLELAAARTNFAGDGSETGNHHHVFPLYSSTRERGAEGEATDLWLAPPIYHHSTASANQASDHDLLLGLFHYGSAGEGATAESSWRALPLFWFTTRRDSAVHLVLPLYYDIRDQDSRYFHFIPFYGKNSEAGGKATKTFIVPPLYIQTRDERKDLSRTDVLFPLIASETSVGGSTHHFWPFYHFSEVGARSSLNALVLFHRITSEVESSTLFWPLYSDRAVRGEGERTGVLPVLDVINHFDSSPPQGDTFSVLWPLSSFKKDREVVSRWIFPFYWWFDDPVGNSTKAIWPFYGIHRDSDHVTHSTLWPLFHFGSDEKGDWSDVGILFPLGNFTHSQTGSDVNQHRRFFPLFSHTSHSYESRTTSGGWVLGPLYTYDNEMDGSYDWQVLWKVAAAEYDFDSDRADFSILHALYRYHREGENVMRSVPFLFRYERNTQGSTFHLFHAIPIHFGND